MAVGRSDDFDGRRGWPREESQVTCSHPAAPEGDCCRESRGRVSLRGDHLMRSLSLCLTKRSYIPPNSVLQTGTARIVLRPQPQPSPPSFHNYNMSSLAADAASFKKTLHRADYTSWHSQPPPLQPQASTSDTSGDASKSKKKRPKSSTFSHCATV